MISRKYKFIDLFAGGGGLSEGFVMNGSFKPLVHIEMNKDACKTLKTRSCYHYLREKKSLNTYNDYLKGKICRDELYSILPRESWSNVINYEISESNEDVIFEQIDSILMKNEKLDLIVGGPPCQAYSLVGRAVSSDRMATDPRNYLYIQYIKFLQRYEPKMFIFENVPGILTAKRGEIIIEMMKAFESVGYKVDYRLLNATDFGVLQNRKRIIIIGWRSNLDLKYPSFYDYNITIEATVYDILKDLPPLELGEERNDYIDKPSEYLLESGIRNNNDILTNHMCRNHNINDLKIYREVIQAWNNEQKRIKYCDLPKEVKTRKNEKAFLDRYKVVAGNVRHSQTMIAHISKDGHYFIHPDIRQCRSISVREAARIQSFPDNYYFEGSRTAKYVQIGNAVPPLMAKGIANEIAEMLED